jgi:hypothetical protein
MDTRRRACTITSRQRRSADRTDRPRWSATRKLLPICPPAANAISEQTNRAPDAKALRETCTNHRSPQGLRLSRNFGWSLTEYNLWDAWNRFKQVELRQMAIEWCKENGITYRQA